MCRNTLSSQNSNKPQATSDYRSAISCSPVYIKPYRLLASLYRKESNFYSALELLNRALRQARLKDDEREAIERERDEVARERRAQEERERKEREERRRRDQEERDERRRREKAARETVRLLAFSTVCVRTWPDPPALLQNHYAVLGIAVGATQTQIRMAYRRKALETHPDKGGCEETFKKVRGRFSFLCILGQ